MAGVYKLEIHQSKDELKQLLRQQRTVSGKERVQLLYLLKSGQAKTVQDAAPILGRNRVTPCEVVTTLSRGWVKSVVGEKSSFWPSPCYSQLGRG